MSEFDLEKVLNAPEASQPPLEPVKPKKPVALGAKAVGNAERLTLTPTEEKEKAAKGKLFLRRETKSYKLGAPERPPYFHDNGHLGNAGEPLTPTRKPTEADKQMQATFVTRLQIGELMCNEREVKKDWPWQNRQRFVKECTGADQPDANLALRNFLFGKGKARRVDYERYLRDEDSATGQPPGTHKVIRTLVNDFIAHAEAIGLNRQKFSITSTQMYAIGDKTAFANGPQTSNWRRTLGSHVIWISGTLTAASAPNGTHIIYEGDLTFEIEDMYNFNPGSSDGQLNIQDKEGGMLELSGLAKQFMTYATIYRHVLWDEGKPQTVQITPGSPPPGIHAFKEDFAKEEADLKKAQADSGITIFPSELAKMAGTFVKRQLGVK